MLSLHTLVALTALAAAAPVLAFTGTGTWSVKNGDTGSVCIHSALLPNSRLLCIERPHTKPYNELNPRTGGFTSTITDLTADTLTPVILRDLATNPFCAGHSQAADGGVWVFGGDRQPSNDSTINFFLQPGIWGKRKLVYDPASNAGVWENEDKHGNMTVNVPGNEPGARWYPTVVTMYDESAFIVSGTTKNLDFDRLVTADLNPTFEYHNPAKAGGALEILQWAYPHMLYPVSFQLPSKKIFLMVSNRTITIDKENGDRVEDLATLVADTPHEPWIYPNSPTSVILPMYEENGYKMTVMVCGGVQRNNNTQASPQCYSLEPETPNARWTRMPDMPRGRLMPDSALLPDGSILFTNGARWGVAGGNAGQVMYAAGPWFDSDLYNPATNTWTANVGRSSVPRLYHSGVLLLEDGSCVTTGSEMSNYQDFWGATEGASGLDFGTPIGVTNISRSQNCWPVAETPCTDAYERRVERFVPPYMTADKTRPSIVSAPTSADYGQLTAIEISPSVKVTNVTLIRYTTTTHNTNTDQRFLGPKILFNNGTHVFFNTPPNSAIAPPGNYHLFVVTADGIPSVARRILLRAGQPKQNVVLPTTASSSVASTAARTSGGVPASATGSVTAAPATSATRTSDATVVGFGVSVVAVVVAAVAGLVMA
ncbi:hypothetical protein HDU96_001564 [Phlyctochytrium bullatum]|nr:hypothetical protein HDU96_001564 [Phlyctochytrium bullatum]